MGDMKDIDIKLMDETVDVLLRQIALIAHAKHKDDHDGYVFFLKNTLVNLIGNVIIKMSNPEVENAEGTNLMNLLNDLDTWFKQVKQIEKNKKETH